MRQSDSILNRSSNEKLLSIKLIFSFDVSETRFRIEAPKVEEGKTVVVEKQLWGCNIRHFLFRYYFYNAFHA
jgi:hypothetical protein